MKIARSACLAFLALCSVVASAQFMSEGHIQRIESGYKAIAEASNYQILQIAEGLINDATADEYVRSFGFEFRGVVRLREDDTEAALADFELALESADNFKERRWDLLYLAALAATQMERLDIAKPYIDEYMADADRKLSDAFYLQARQTFAAGDPMAAIVLIESAMQRAEEDFGFGGTRDGALRDWLDLWLSAAIAVGDPDGVYNAYRSIDSTTQTQPKSIEIAAALHRLGDCRRAQSVADDLMKRWPSVESAEISARIFVDCASGARGKEALRILIAERPDAEYAEPILIAIIERDQRAIAELTEGDYPINEVIGSQQTALTYAIRIGEADSIKALLNAGADPSVPDAIGVTPLEAAGESGWFYIESIIREALGLGDE